MPKRIMNDERKLASWDKRYRRGEDASDEPLPLLVEAVAGLTPGRALDIACGLGRHTLYLAERGWQVTAVDASPVAIERLLTHAREKRITVDARLADLQAGQFIIEPETYDLICDANYLQHDLFPAMRAGVRRRGLVILAIYLVDGTPGIKPMNARYLLRRGELLAKFSTWTILRYTENRSSPEEHGRLRAELAARRP